MKKYRNIVKDLEIKISALKDDGVKIDALDDLLNELTSHVEHVTEVEDHIDAIRGMVIEPVKKELEENKKAGKFSIAGFYIGAFGLIASIASVFYTNFQPSPELIIRDEATQNKLTQIQKGISEVRRELYFRAGKLEVGDSAVKIKNYDEYTVVRGDDVEIKIELYAVRVYSNETTGSERNVAHLKVFYDGRLVSRSGVPEIVQTTNVGRINSDSEGYFPVSKGDVITFLKEHQVQIVEVLNEEATFNTLSDNETAIIISVVGSSNKSIQPTANATVD